MAKWSVLLYMNADKESLSDVAITNIKELSQVGSTEDVNIVILLDRLKTKDFAEADDFFSPTIYKINKEPDDASPNDFLINPLKVLGKDFENMGDPKTLKAFLDFVTTNNECVADNYVITFWDHGGGVFIEGDGREEVAALMDVIPHQLQMSLLATQRRKRVSQSIENTFLHRPGLGLLNAQLKENNKPEEDGLLYMTEINSTIEKVFPERKINILLFDACWMQTLENAYTLKEKADYLVASENTFSSEGIGYRYFLNFLVKNPDVTSERLADHIVNSTFLKLSREKFSTISSVDLSQVDKLVGKLETIVNIFITASADKQKTLYAYAQSARFLCQIYYDISDPINVSIESVDLLYFLEKLLAYAVINNEDNDDFKAPLKNAIEDFILFCESYYITNTADGFEIQMVDDTMKCWGAQGFSIFFPDNPFDWQWFKKNNQWYFLEPPNQIPFTNTKWKVFLEQYMTFICETYGVKCS